MGTWGHRAFENDVASDWAYDLEDTSDLSLVESTFADLEGIGGDSLGQDIGCNALAACEVLARCLGNTGYRDAYTENVDAWVASHSQKPSPELLKRASAAIQRILGNHSELRDLWEESDEFEQWREAVEDLGARLRDSPS